MQTVPEARVVALLGDWRAAGVPAPGYVRLAAAVRALLLDARLPVAARLPAERRMADVLGVSRTTVAAAYRMLREEGYLASRRGSGSVTALPPGRFRRHAPWVPAVPDDADALDLALASPQACAEVPAAMTAALRDLPGYLHGHGYDSYGLPVLREAVARRYARRGLPTAAEQIFITCGAQHALDLLLRCLISPLDPVLAESPGYPNALDCLDRARARVMPVRVGPDGWDIDALASALRQGLPRLAYLMPDFHNPAGHFMDAGARAAVVAAAATAGTRLIADETFAELPLGGLVSGDPPAAPLAAWDPAGYVITVGSMSKAFWAGLRIGWVRAEPGLVGRLQEARGPSDMASPVVEQLAAAWLLDRADDLLPARRAMLAARRDVLAAALGEHMPGWSFRLPGGGLSLWARLDAPVSSALTRAAERHKLRLVPGTRFGQGGGMERYLRLPFTLPEPELREAVLRLAAARADLGPPGEPPSRVPVV